MKGIHNVHLTLLSVTCSSHDRGREGATVEERGERERVEGEKRAAKEREGEGKEREGKKEGRLLVGWLVNVPSTCQ